MVENPSLPELLSVVRCDDHQRVRQQSPTVEIVQQSPDLAVQEGDAVIVAVARDSATSRGLMGTLFRFQ